MGSFFPPYEASCSNLPPEAVERVLRTLLVDCLCLTESQVRDCVNFHLPTKERHLREMRRIVRSFLDRLEGAGLVAKQKVSFVPPVTVSVEPILKDDQLFCALDEWPLDELNHVAQASQARVPPLENHTEERIYFATADACTRIRSYGLLATLPEVSLPIDQEGRFELLAKIIEKHPRGGVGPLPTQHEISRSRLTAQINLAQLLFMDGFAERHLTGERVYEVVTQEENGWPYGRIARRSPPGQAPNPYIALIFLGALSPHQVGKLLSDRRLAGRPSRVWLM